MARILFPEDYGFLAMAAAFGGLIQLLGNLGIPACVIQDDSNDERLPISAFYLNLGVLVILAALQFGLSYGAAYYFKSRLVGELLRWMCILYVLSAMTQIHQALLKKELNFGTLLFADVSRDICTSGFRIYFALAGFGPLSFIFGDIIGYAVRVPIVWIRSQFIPRITHISRVSMKKIFWFGGHSFYGSIAGFLSRELDKFVMVKIFSPASLGMYSFAYGQAVSPYANIIIPQNGVSFSLLANSKGDLPLFSRRYLTITGLYGFLMVPIYLFLIASAHELIPAVFGAKWSGAVPLFMVFCSMQLMYSLAALSNDVLLALGLPNVRSRYSVAEFLLIVVMLSVLFFHKNILLLSFSITIAVSLRYFFQVGTALDKTGTQWRSFLSKLKLPFLYAGLSCLVFTVPYTFSNKLVDLLSKGLGFFAVYLLAYYLIKRQVLFEIASQLLGASLTSELPVLGFLFRREISKARKR
jgi:PST family polysaccharide transporter